MPFAKAAPRSSRATPLARTDSAHTGLLASDPYQSPAASQYPWLAGQLDKATGQVVVIATHMPAYDPHPVANSQMADRWEARMYERLAQKYQQSHPDKHVMLMFGHSRGYAEQVLLPDGTLDPSGLPNFTVADAGVTPYADPEHGGFYQYGLFRFTDHGDVEFAVQAVFDSVTVSGPATLGSGQSVSLTATAAAPVGNTAPFTVPVDDPIARTWTSSDPSVATVDPASGKVTAQHPGTVQISCTSGGVRGSLALTVTR